MFPNATFRDVPAHLKWRCVSVAPGESLEGVTAGALVTVDCHWDCGRSFPCLSRLTDGVLKCSCEDEPRSLRLLGYQPIMTKERERLVVLLSATVAQKVETIRHGTAVRFTRPKKGKRPLSVTLLSDYDLGEDFVKKMRAAALHDIHEYLIHLWQDRTLCDHFGVPFICSTTNRAGATGEVQAV